jgi:hypothetical protein
VGLCYEYLRAMSRKSFKKGSYKELPIQKDVPSLLEETNYSTFSR